MNKVRINSDVELKDRLVAINRVTKVTKGGRTFTFAAIVVVGDGNGIIGWGLGKAGEVTAAIAKGVEAAKKNLVKVPVLKGTIPHEMEARFGGAQVYLRPAAAGTGLVAGGAMRAVLESVGVKDVLAKSKGSSNPHNLVKATIEALSQMRDAYTVAGNRGISTPLLETVVSVWKKYLEDKEKELWQQLRLSRLRARSDILLTRSARSMRWVCTRFLRL